MSRPAPPPLRLPAPRRRPGGFIASFLIHAVILLLLARYGVELVLGSGNNPFGARGGGGGAGGSVHIVDLPAAAAASAPAPAAPVPQPVVHTVPPPAIDPAPTLTPPALQPLAMKVSPAVATVGTMSDGTTGHGPGAGGGTGAGAGPGVGNDSGPGSGGNGAYINPPSPRVVLLAARCLHGNVSVLLSVGVDGRVTHVQMEPEVKNRDCRREMMDKMMGYEFLPARTRDGRAVADTFRVTWQQ